MGTSTVSIQPMKIKDVQFFNKSVLLKLLSFCFCAAAFCKRGKKDQKMTKVTEICPSAAITTQPQIQYIIVIFGTQNIKSPEVFF